MTIPRTIRALLMAVFLAAATAGVTACEDDPALPADAPEGHTVNQDGVAHAPGLQDPLTNCTQCHGADLMGGNAGQPSCFSCHGEVW